MEVLHYRGEGREREEEEERKGGREGGREEGREREEEEQREGGREGGRREKEEEVVVSQKSPCSYYYQHEVAGMFTLVGSHMVW